MKQLIQSVYLITLMLWCSGCAVPSGLKGYRSLSTNEKNLADSILLYALDHEALYTLLDSIKPISSVKMVRYPIAPDSTHNPGTVSQIKNPLYIDSLDSFYRLNDKLSGAEVAFVAIPFKATDKEYKNVQMYAVRRSSLLRVITEQSSFFGQLGITQNTPAHSVISIIEHAQAYDRWRGYGYLFGYPNHAVDFFVQAGISQDSTGKFVERQFFHVPVFAGNSGHFTYALPKDYTTSDIDSSIYHKASTKLAQYKRSREKWIGEQKLKTKRILKKMNADRFYFTR